MKHLPPPAGLIEAAETVRHHPLRWSGPDESAAVEKILERGWFSSPLECARVLSATVGADAATGQAFGGPWPVFESRGWWIAPALPVPVGSESVQGIDGEYSYRRDTVLREAAGAERPFLSTGGVEAPPGAPFDLLWFGETERFTVVGGTLEIEDLFSVLRVSAGRGIVERLLVRARRMDPGVLEGLVFAEPSSWAEIEVRRPTAATGGENWRQPAAFLSARADVKTLEQHGDEMTAETVQGSRAVFSTEATPGGWRLRLIDGPYALTNIHLEQREGAVSLRATPDASIDPMAPGMRGRLAFDLRADLVALD